MHGGKTDDRTTYRSNEPSSGFGCSGVQESRFVLFSSGTTLEIVSCADCLACTLTGHPGETTDLSRTSPGQAITWMLTSIAY